ncbi:MAG: cobalamin biosynthesis protein CbiX [Verrucomicrobia bacterium]|nr:cobalamin biosynthesis protein CbiX [Verrucomicrobiota bacterium]MDA1065764.1 cobalamin biosynthesis protein CbiX [Verrucomicrobiota bacterium]
MIFLVDNGSIRADAYLNLCRIADDLSKVIGEKVIPAPLLHGDKIPPEQLDGKVVKVLEKQLVEAIEEGSHSFTILPFFFGESGAIHDYLPRRIRKVAENHPTFRAKILGSLYQSKSNGGDILVKILRDRVLETMEIRGLKRCKVVLVDHGSPRESVTTVRNVLAELLQEEMNSREIDVSPASMERRNGSAYDFNEPLLEKILNQPPYNSGAVIIAQLFLSPGRHAGPEGDISAICESSEKDNKDLNTYRTELVGTHPLLIDLLVRRWGEGKKLSFKTFNT